MSEHDDTIADGNEDDSSALPEHIGPYRLIRALGSGGMGEVHLAEQSAPIRRQVALKIIKRGMDTREVVARFEAERRALAKMNHPCIAQVFDAGETEQGLPYFAMEYVDGTPISDYCDVQRLDTQARLELFLKVCAGIQHAHQKAIIHRDLKPTNILVTEQDGEAVPKIIDFGIARATDQRHAEKTLFTRMGQIIGTPAYMSPEQASPSGDDIDTRTDIYSLGVVLYELLVGLTPFDLEKLYSAGYEGMVKVIREQDPPRPSTRLRQSGDHASKIAVGRRTEPGRLVGQLSGDLDWILLKTLEKDRARRYETPSSLAEDIQRYLHHEAVLATPPSASYRLGKLLRRNRAAFATIATIGLVLVVASIVSTSMYVRAERASRVAQSEAEKSNQVARFLGDMLEGVGPAAARGRDTEMLREILDNTVARVGDELADQPEVEAALRYRLGATYYTIGEYQAGETQLRRALELQSEHSLPQPERAILLRDLGVARWRQGERAEAEELLEESLRILSTTRTRPDADLARTLFYLGGTKIDLSRIAEGDSLVLLAIDDFRRLEGEERSVADALMQRSNVLLYRGEYDEAETLVRDALELHTASLGDDHPILAEDWQTLSSIQVYRGELDGAEESLNQAMAIQEKVLGERHADIAVTLKSLAIVELTRGNYSKAEELAQEALDIVETTFGEETILSAEALDVIAAVELNARGNFPRAMEIYEDVLRIQNDHLEAPHVAIAQSFYNMARLLYMQAKYVDCLPLYRDAYEMQLAAAGADNQETILYRNDYARVFPLIGRAKEGVRHLRAVLASRERLIGETHYLTAITRVDLAVALERTARAEVLDESEALIRRGIADYVAALGENQVSPVLSRWHLARILRKQAKLEESNELSERVIQETGSMFGMRAKFTQMARAERAGVLLRLGLAVEAAELAGVALDERFGALPGDGPGQLRMVWGTALLDVGRFAEAEQLLLAGFDALDAALGAEFYAAQDCVRGLIRLYESTRRPDEALQWRARLVGAEGS